MRNKEIKKFDNRNNLIYHKTSLGNEFLRKYDKNNNVIYYKSTSGYQLWFKYNEKNRLIYFKDNYNDALWYKYNDNNNKKIVITEQEYNEIEFRKKEKEYLSRKKCSRFEIMDI